MRHAFIQNLCFWDPSPERALGVLPLCVKGRAEYATVSAT